MKTNNTAGVLDRISEGDPATKSKLGWAVYNSSRQGRLSREFIEGLRRQ